MVVGVLQGPVYYVSEVHLHTSFTVLAHKCVIVQTQAPSPAATPVSHIL